MSNLCKELCIEYLTFENLIFDITRGAQIKASELNKLRTTEETENRYLMLSHMNNGIFDYDNNDQFLTHIPKNYERFCIQTKSLIISKIGRPLKTVIVPHYRNINLLATGNVYVAVIDESIIDIRYLQSFLQSQKGLEALDKVSIKLKENAKDKNIKHISLERLMNMEVPVPPREVQEKIATKYDSLYHEITFLSREMRKLQKEFCSLWSEHVE